MHFSTIIATALLGASTTMAVPAMKRNNQILCPGLEGTPQCCAVNALNLADLNCGPPPMVPSTLEQFTKICASIGQQAQCCLLPTLGQGLLCESPPAVGI